MNSADQALGKRTVAVLWALVVGLGCWWRAAGISDSPLYGDEFHGARIANLGFGEILGTYDAFGTHVPLPLLQRAATLLLGPSLLALRLPALLAGMLALVLVYPALRPWIGRGAALVATAAVSASPLLVYYSRFARAYALEVLLALALVGVLARWRERGWKLGPWAVAWVALLALTPWVHLASAGLVAGLVIATAGLGWASSGRAAGAVRPLLLGALAAGVCALLFWPVHEAVFGYLSKYDADSQDLPDGVGGILELLAGGREAAWAFGLGVPVALAWLARARPAAAAVFGSAVLGPVAVLAVGMPHGMGFAYARYLIVGLPFALGLIAWLCVRVAGERRGAVLGLVLVAAGHFTGARSPARPDDRPFDNTQLALAELPAFDRAFPGAPALYAELAADTTITGIVEVPALTSRSVLLYRNYRLIHGKRVWVGLAPAEAESGAEERFERYAPVETDGPYVRLDAPEAFDSRAQVIVLHKDVLAEVRAYWHWVYTRAWPRMQGSGRRGLMRRLGLVYFREHYLAAQSRVTQDVLTSRFGAPSFEDATLVVWDLR